MHYYYYYQKLLLLFIFSFLLISRYSSRLIYSSLCTWLFFGIFCIFGWGVGGGWGSSSASSAFVRLNLLLYEPQMGKK